MDHPLSHSGLIAERSKALCEIIIETLREVRLTTTRPLSAELLGEFLVKSGAYIEKLHAIAELFIPEDQLEFERLIVRFQEFQIDLLESFKSNSNQNFDSRAEKLIESVRMKSRTAELFDLNNDIIKFVGEASTESSKQIETYLHLISEITKDLIEVEKFLSSSSSSLNKTQQSNKSFDRSLEDEMKNISDVLQTNQSVDELRKFIEIKLGNIRQSLIARQTADQTQVNKLASEIDVFKTRLKKMKKEITKVQKKAETLEKASLLDHLTGIPNRRAYEKYMREEWDRYQQTQDGFSLLMIDIDNFKAINDQYGHWAGDKCLEELVKRVRSKLREADFLARYGGDEFLVVLPRTNKDGAVYVSEKLRSHIEQTRFLYRGQRIPFGISIGVCAIEPSDQNLKSILNRVDKALYNAKAGGRNRIFMV